MQLVNAITAKPPAHIPQPCASQADHGPHNSVEEDVLVSALGHVLSLPARAPAFVGRGAPASTSMRRNRQTTVTNSEANVKETTNRTHATRQNTQHNSALAFTFCQTQFKHNAPAELCHNLATFLGHIALSRNVLVEPALRSTVA